MTQWRAFEIRWRDELCRAAVPRLEGSGLPGWADLDDQVVWCRFDDIAPTTLRRGWRVTVWVLTLRLRLRWRRPRRLTGLTPADQEAALLSLLDHRSHVVRQLASVLQLVVCFGYLGDADVRARTTEWVSP